MAITSYFYDSIGADRTYSASDFAKAFGILTMTGIIADAAGDTGFDIGGTNYTTVWAGKAVVEGRFVELTGSEILTVPAGTYSGMVVLRVDITGTRAASLKVRADRVPQQDSTAYELPLYDCTVSNGIITGVTDRRFQGGARPAMNTNSLKNSSETGFCGTGAINSSGTTTAVSGSGVNFRQKKTYVPSSISLTTLGATAGVTGQAAQITADGFYLYINGTGGAGLDVYHYWRGTYSG